MQSWDHDRRSAEELCCIIFHWMVPCYRSYWCVRREQQGWPSACVIKCSQRNIKGTLITGATPPHRYIKNIFPTFFSFLNPCSDACACSRALEASRSWLAGRNNGTFGGVPVWWRGCSLPCCDRRGDVHSSELKWYRQTDKSWGLPLDRSAVDMLPNTRLLH